MAPHRTATRPAGGHGHHDEQQARAFPGEVGTALPGTAAEVTNASPTQTATTSIDRGRSAVRAPGHALTTAVTATLLAITGWTANSGRLRSASRWQQESAEAERHRQARKARWRRIRTSRPQIHGRGPDLAPGSDRLQDGGDPEGDSAARMAVSRPITMAARGQSMGQYATAVRG